VRTALPPSLLRAEGLPAEAIKREFLAMPMKNNSMPICSPNGFIQLGGDPNFDPIGLAERSHAELRHRHGIDRYFA